MNTASPSLRALLIARVGSAGSLRGQLLRGGIGSLGIMLANTSLGLVLAILLARKLGPEGYGIYSYVFALISLLAVPAQLGLPTLAVRETAKAQANEHWGTMRGLWRWTSLAVGVLSVALAIVALGVAWLFADRFTTVQFTTFALGLLLVPLVALGNLRGAALRGLQRVVVGQLPELVLRPGLLILFLLAALLYLPQGSLTPVYAMGLHTVAAAVAFVVGAGLLWRLRPSELAAAPALMIDSRAWISAAVPLALIAGMRLINHHTDLLMLGLFANAEQVGIYKVVLAGAALVALGLGAVNMVVAPSLARLHAQGDRARLQQLVTLSIRAILLLALPLVLVFILFGEDILGLIFGAEYTPGYKPLVILALGQLVNAATGPVGALLNMTGHERDTLRGIGVAAAINIALNAFLIPFYGMIGAAIATTVSLTTWNIMLCYLARLRLGVTSNAVCLTK